MTEEAGGHLVATTAWRCASADELRVLDLLEDKLLGVVETSGVNGLPEKLARRLGSVGVKLGHVDIIDEEDHLLATRGS